MPTNPAAMNRQMFSGTGSQTVFTLASDPGALGNGTVIYINGVYQQKNTYTTAGTVLTFTEAPPAGTNNIEVVNFVLTNVTTTNSDFVNYVPAGAGAVARTGTQKFAETISVKDFGAVGDGVANDAAAIQAALNSGARKITFPAGSYLVNTRIQCSQSDIEIDFGSAILLNTVELPVVVVYGFDTNAMFDFTGNAVRISGGIFRNGLSQCIRITGVSSPGDTFIGIGYTTSNRVSNMVFDNCRGNACNISFFTNSTMDNLVVLNKTRDPVTGSIYSAQEFGFLFGTGSTITSCQVINSQAGGGAYHLFVNGFVCSNNVFSGLNNTASEATVRAMYASNSYNGVINGNIAEVTGGVGLKCSYDCRNVSICSNTMSVAGTAGGGQYAAIFLQGVDGFVIDGNRLSNVGNHVIRLSFHTSPANLNTKNGVVSNNWCTTTYGTGIASRTYDGDGIYVASLTTATRGPIDIVGNRLVTGNLVAAQLVQSRISNNMLSNNDSSNTYLSSSGAVFIDRCVKCLIESNHVTDDTMSGTRYGIRLFSCGLTFVYDNVVQYDPSYGIGATAFYQDGTPGNNTWVENLPLYAATAYSGIGGAGARQTQTIRTTQTFDMANVPANDTITFTRTVTGAILGDMVIVNALGSTGSPQDSLVFNAYVTAADTVTVIASNNTASAIDLTSRDYNILLIKQATY